MNARAGAASSKVDAADPGVPDVPLAVGASSAHVADADPIGRFTIAVTMMMPTMDNPESEGVIGDHIAATRPAGG